MTNTVGAEALQRLADASPQTKTVVLTTSAGGVDVIEALQAGACGYILKDTQPAELIDGIRQTAGSQVVLSREVVRVLVKHTNANDHPLAQARSVSDRPALTPREQDVLRLIVEGADNAAIGLELSISRHTVKQHVTNIFEKLSVRTRVEAAVHAVRSGLC